MNTNTLIQKLYDEDAYLTTFTACVKEVAGGELVLDRTAFFPEAGGQLSDTGTLYAPDGKGGEIALTVRDVQISEGVIRHRLELAEGCADSDGPFVGRRDPGDDEDASSELLERLLQPGMTLRGEIDRERRYDFMQQHTAEHIISGLVNARFGYDNVGFRLSDNSCTMDYSGVLTPEQIPELELAANRVIWDNLPVLVSFPSEEEQESITYRSKKEIASDELRIVTIPDIDTCACCAPHVRHTGEIGLVKIIRLQNWKGGVRLCTAAGRRALSLFTEEHDMITQLARSLSTSWENIPDRFQKMREETGLLKKELKEYRKNK
ncbi:MAG: alanyl-tRNA editing protein [Lachnospiraceae bacterium]|nr:alanyl-tRNA editing protein [Lachnospiraceae bacterium]